MAFIIFCEAFLFHFWSYHLDSFRKQLEVRELRSSTSIKKMMLVYAGLIRTTNHSSFVYNGVVFFVVDFWFC